MVFFSLNSALVRRKVQSRYFYTHAVGTEEMIALRIFALVRFLVLGTATAAAATTTSQRNHHNNNDLRSVSFGKWPFLSSTHEKVPTRLMSSVTMEPDVRRLRITISTTTPISDTSTQPTASTTAPIAALSNPLIEESVWEELSGEEFQQNPELVDALATTAVQVATNDTPDEWIDWRENQRGNIEEGAICVWTGKSRNGSCKGSQIPLIKTRSIIPLSTNEMVDLMMDSERVKTYNTWSIGRSDCWVHNDHTKIVQNRVQPPVGSKLVVSTALLHARPCQEEEENGTWVIVTRAVKGFETPSNAGVSEILLGVNLLEPVDATSCRLTAVNHVYSSSIPTMLAERVGVQSAVKFVKDLRRLKEEGKL